MSASHSNSLETFMQAVAELSDARMCLNDFNPTTLDSEELDLDKRWRTHVSPVCLAMKTCAEGVARCLATENWKTREAAKHPDGFLHTCYAGVTDFILPVQMHGRHAGALCLGQVVVEAPAELERVRKRLKAEFPVAPAKLDEAFAVIPRLTKRRLRSLGRMLELPARYIERAEQVLALKNEYHLRLEEIPRTPAEAVRTNRVPLKRLRTMRSVLEGKNAERIREALTLIERNYNGRIKHSSVARAVGLSPAYFSREFSRHTGLTFRRVLLETRLTAAFFLMQRYHCLVSEAGYLVGYEDDLAFRRAFKKMLGASPRQFLKLYPRSKHIFEEEALPRPRDDGPGAAPAWKRQGGPRR